jgi:CBS domain-containing protein
MLVRIGENPNPGSARRRMLRSRPPRHAVPMKVGDLMERNVVTAAPELPLKQLAVLLVEHGVSGVPVVTPDGRVCGVVSEADVIRKVDPCELKIKGFLGRLLDRAYGDESRYAARTVGEAMTAPALTISPEQDVSEAARLMVEKHVNRLPVVEDGALVGIVTRADVVRAFQRSDETIAREIVDDVLFLRLWIAPGSIDVDVGDGVVTLEGRVDSQEIAAIVETYVRRVPGVVAVESNLEWPEAA